MSEFDKEKEREKLRKQLAGEEERRKTTKQMSELLLKGATMLNIHCDRCKSPIFRYEGEEFCPTCERTVDELKTEPTSEKNQEPDQPITDGQSQTIDSSRTHSSSSPPQTNAGEALEATISRLADRAATADDPRQATELLEAARIAAETLALVEGRSQSGS